MESSGLFTISRRVNKRARRIRASLSTSEYRSLILVEGPVFCYGFDSLLILEFGQLTDLIQSVILEFGTQRTEDA